MMNKILVSGAALAAALALTAPAQATTYFSGFTTAASPSGLTPIINFSAPGGTQISVFVDDCCIVGDYYATYVDGILIGTTPAPTTALSSATFLTTLGAGSSHNFQLVDQDLAILPAGVFVQIDSVGVPEPATWALMLTGVFGLGGALRARRSRNVKPEGQAA